MKMGQRVIVQFLFVLDLESLQFVENVDLWALICTVLIKDLTVNGKKKKGGGEPLKLDFREAYWRAVTQEKMLIRDLKLEERYLP